MRYLNIRLLSLESGGSGPGKRAELRRAEMEFHILRDVREEHGLNRSLFSLTGNVILADFRAVRELAGTLNAKVNAELHPERIVKAGQLNAMGLIDEILHYVAALYREQVQPDAFETALGRIGKKLGKEKTDVLLRRFCELFPPQAVYEGRMTVDEYLAASEDGESHRAMALEELMLLALANLNPAFSPFYFLFDDAELEEKTVYSEAIEELKAHFAELPPFGPDGLKLWDLLRSPALASPDSLSGQLDFIRKKWGLLIGQYLMRLLTGLDVIKEEEKPVFFGPGPTAAYEYGALEAEYERFSPDQDWMPRTVLMAKTVLVWLFQLSQKYGREITRLDQIPDEELDELARRGFTGLWLIGLWERSKASRTVKQWTGNPEAAASAYSLYDYDIAAELGGWGALTNLRDRCAWRGIRLGSDMVPNHTGIDSRWIMEHPDRFLQLRYPPFPSYTYNGGNLSGRDDVGVYIEDHYYNRSDAAVVFKRVDFNTGDVRYIYHGNDGTSMPWNDTAQIDFLNPEAREAVIRTIVGVCKQFPIVRFDAAMTLAKRHIQRLWYPEPGHGGDIASRAEHAISLEEFNRRIPNEFWREVVDRCAEEAPNTLLLAEAFWMMEGYFVRTLGMHRVYNSAFMNMLKNEENAKYRATIRNTLEFDPEILKRFVNFMNNPDEETAVAQFGNGDKYFGICTLMATMPGLPMFGHGQIEGFEEKYGMEYRRAYYDEEPDRYLVERHEREIFPLLKKRTLFSGSEHFTLYDMFTQAGGVNENVFAYSNRHGGEKTLVLYNNCFERASGWIHRSAVAVSQRDGSLRRNTLAESLSLNPGDRNFTLFREQRSDLWFIRSSKELSERGLFVALNGYEAQVFLDIHELEDTDTGRWARLNHELDGRGVRDLHAAIQDIFLDELYKPLMALFTPELVEGLYRSFTGELPEKKHPGPVFTAAAYNSEKNPSGVSTGENPGAPSRRVPQDISSLMAALKDPVFRFINIAVKYLDGVEGKYDPFIRAAGYERMDQERIWEQFADNIRGFINISEYAARVPRGVTAEGRKLLSELASAVHERPALSAYVAAYEILTLLRPILGENVSGADAKALADHWCIDRKLREALAALGISQEESLRVIETMEAVLSRSGKHDAPEAPPPEKNGSEKAAAGSGGKAGDAGRTDPNGSAGSAGAMSAEKLILDSFEAEDLRAVLGVNLFDDVLWFNRERFGEALFFIPLFALAGGGCGIDCINTAAKLWDELKRAEAVSEYRLDKLLSVLRNGEE